MHIPPAKSRVSCGSPPPGRLAHLLKQRHHGALWSFTFLLSISLASVLPAPSQKGKRSASCSWEVTRYPEVQSSPLSFPSDHKVPTGVQAGSSTVWLVASLLRRPFLSPGTSSWPQPLRFPMPNPLGAATGFPTSRHSSQPCSLGPTDHMGEKKDTGPRGDAGLGGVSGEGGWLFQNVTLMQSVVTTTLGREQPSFSHPALTGRSWRLINEPQLIGAVKSNGEGSPAPPLRRQTGKSEATEVWAQRNCLMEQQRVWCVGFRPLLRSQAGH